MKNELVLDNYGVQELQAEERMDVEGGWIWTAVKAAIGWYVYNTLDDQQASKAAFQRGWDAAPGGNPKPPSN